MKTIKSLWGIIKEHKVIAGLCIILLVVIISVSIIRNQKDENLVAREDIDIHIDPTTTEIYKPNKEDTAELTTAVFEDDVEILQVDAKKEVLDLTSGYDYIIVDDMIRALTNSYVYIPSYNCFNSAISQYAYIYAPNSGFSIDTSNLQSRLIDNTTLAYTDYENNLVVAFTISTDETGKITNITRVDTGESITDFLYNEEDFNNLFMEQISSYVDDSIEAENGESADEVVEESEDDKNSEDSKEVKEDKEVKEEN